MLVVYCINLGKPKMVRIFIKFGMTNNLERKEWTLIKELGLHPLNKYIFVSQEKITKTPMRISSSVYATYSLINIQALFFFSAFWPLLHVHGSNRIEILCNSCRGDLSRCCVGLDQDRVLLQLLQRNRFGSSHHNIFFTRV